MNPLLWWWRWWSRVISPNRDDALVNAQKAIEEQRAKADRLSSELEAKDAEIAALQARLSQAERTASQPEPQAAPQPEPQAAPSQAVAEPQTEPQPQAVPDGAPPEPQMEPDSGAPEPQAAPKQPERKPASPPDISTATVVLGTPIRPDDLTVIEGIGPKIAELLSNAGFSTWHALSEADTDELRRLLQEAGPRFRIHDPAKWPPQAALLAQGQWQEYKELRAKIRTRSS